MLSVLTLILTPLALVLAVSGLVMSIVTLLIGIAAIIGVTTFLDDDAAVSRLEQQVQELSDQLPTTARPAAPPPAAAPSCGALHDVGLATWFGGSLMGAVALNGASGHVPDPTDRLPVATAGWARWAPVQGAAIGAHLLGGAVLLHRNRGRATAQAGVRANTNAKLALTGAALVATARVGALGARTTTVGPVPTTNGVTPNASTPGDVAALLHQLRVWQWAPAVLTGAMVALTSQQGELQKPDQIARGLTRTLLARARR